MRTIRIKAYKFEELSESVQEKVIADNYNINFEMGDWWENVYDDAKHIGLEIKSSDIHRNDIDGEFIESSQYTAHRIIAEHGEHCDTYKSAQAFLADVDRLEEKAQAEGTDGDEDYWYSDEMQTMESEFLLSLLNDYLKMLKEEDEYLSSREAIEETIISNGYEFTKDGKSI